MKRISALLLIFISLNASAQTVTKYYDADWIEIPAEKAEFKAEFVKVSEDYNCISYWLKTGKVRGISVFTDTSFINAKGLQRLYDRKGNLEDSIFFYPDGKIKSAFSFYPDGTLECHYEGNEEGKQILLNAYDETGKRVRKYVYYRPAEPKDGIVGWQRFISESVDPFLTSSPNMPLTAKVNVRFTIDETGQVLNAAVIKSCGMKQVDDEALAIIKASPKWKPAIVKNKVVKVSKIQPFTFELSPPKRRYLND